MACHTQPHANGIILHVFDREGRRFKPSPNGSAVGGGRRWPSKAGPCEGPSGRCHGGGGGGGEGGVEDREGREPGQGPSSRGQLAYNRLDIRIGAFRDDPSGGGGHSRSQERLVAGQTGNSQGIVTASSLHRHKVTPDGGCSQPCDGSASENPPPRHHLRAGDWGGGALGMSARASAVCPRRWCDAISSASALSCATSGG